MRSRKRKREEVTIRDVAARAGVSVATISRVFNDSTRVRKSTRQRVLALAEEMRYVPHAAARSLSMRTTRTVGVVLPELHGEFFSEVIRGIDLSARKAEYHLLVSGSHSDHTEMREVLQAVRGRVDGLIVMSPELDASSLIASLPHDIPVVLLNSRIEGHRSIMIDNYGGARAMVRHLASLGHRRIAFIAGPEQNGDAAERRRGFRAAVRRLRIDADRRLEIPGEFTEESGYVAVRRILALSPRPTAVFASNDAMAIGALSALREAGVRVPDDLALVGFDDIPIARYLAPPLTTVKVPIEKLGRSGFELLLSAKAADATRTAILETTLIIRDSSGASPGETPVTSRQIGAR